MAAVVALSVSSPLWAQEPSSPDPSRDVEPIGGLDAYVQGAMNGWPAPGLSLVIVQGDRVTTRAYGVTEVGGSVPVTPRTLFGIGSLTKAFTATILGVLVDEDVVEWDDPVVQHLPDFAMYDAYVTDHLTIRDILSHRTGLAGDDLMWVAGGRSPQELIRRVRFQEPSHGFRARFGYHNVMYLLAGEVAEAATGESWARLIRRRLFEPLGMSRTTATLEEARGEPDVALPHDEIGPGQVLGTVPRPDVPLTTPDTVRRIRWFDSETAPAGGIASTAADFGSWLRFQLAGGEVDGRRLLGTETLVETRTPQTPLPALSRSQTKPSVTNIGAYGMGWGLRDYRGHLMVSHLGSTQGWSGAVALLPARDLGAAVFVNTTRGTGLADAMVRWILDRFLGAERRDWSGEALERRRARQARARATLAEAARARATGTEPSLPMDAYVGTYVDSLYPPARVSRVGDALRLELGPRLAGALDHWEDDTFRVTWDRAEFGANLVTFHVAADSHPARLATRILGRSGVWHRSDP